MCSFCAVVFLSFCCVRCVFGCLLWFVLSALMFAFVFVLFVRVFAMFCCLCGVLLSVVRVVVVCVFVRLCFVSVFVSSLSVALCRTTFSRQWSFLFCY